jgi:hypothetical protein
VRLASRVPFPQRPPHSEATKPMGEFRTRRRGKMPRVVVIFGKDT